MQDPHPPTWSASPLVVILLVALAASFWLVRGYIDAVLVAAVVSILAWPLHTRVLRLVRGRRSLGTGLTLLTLTLGVFVPATMLGVVVAREVVVLANEVITKVQLGDWDTLVKNLVRTGPMRWLADAVGGRTALIDGIEAATRQGVLELAATVTQNVPGLLSVTVGVVLKVVVFFLSTATLFRRGPELLDLGRKVSPLTAAQTERLYGVFVEFARNVVLAGLVAGILQGIVATAGFLLAGVERALLFGALTAVFAYVPLIGTTFVWVPVSVLLLTEGRMAAAVFVAIWSLALTGTVDNLVRPFIVRGRSNVPLVVVFLGAFGGLGTFGIIGLLVGPVLLAMVLALLQIYAELRTHPGGG